MATKNSNNASRVETLEIDREAFRRLEEARNEGESFSEVIKRCVHPRRTAEEVLRAMRRAAVSSSTLRTIEESAKRRRRTAHKTKD
jgi:predicted CopG family antitoxin